MKDSHNTILADIGILILRVFIGATMLLQHGLGKWEKLFSGNEIKFADPFGIGDTLSLTLVVFAEVICAIFLSIGLFTRWSLLPLLITMFVAVFIIHSDHDFGKMEKGLLYGVSFITLLLTGPGKFSLDAFLKQKK